MTSSALAVPRSVELGQPFFPPCLLAAVMAVSERAVISASCITRCGILQVFCYEDVSSSKWQGGLAALGGATLAAFGQWSRGNQSPFYALDRSVADRKTVPPSSTAMSALRLDIRTGSVLLG